MSAELLKAIRARKNRKSEFGYGILTADKYGASLRDCVGIEACNKYAATRSSSFDDLMRKAAKTLVYSNEDMAVDGAEVKLRNAKNSLVSKVDGIELPKNTLMVFRHVLTTPRKDRDGDILRTKGAIIDPKMLLLWQHVHTLPIGKMLNVDEHTDERLSLNSCIVDINQLCHDAAVMVDNGMGRFSHGFGARKFDRIKDGETEDGDVGFDVTEFEIMEESLVSVPSNVDAETEDVILSLVEGGKLKSPLMKTMGQSIREKRAVSVPVTVDLKLLVNGKAVGEKLEGESHAHEHQCGACKAAGKGKQGAPDQADAGQSGKGKAEDEEVKQCPECKGDMQDGVCQDCGYEDSGDEGKSTSEESSKGDENLLADMHDAWGFCPRCGTKFETDNTACAKCGYARNTPGKSSGASGGEKAGRTLSKANESKIRNAKEVIDEAAGMENVPRACKSMMKEASGDLGSVLSSLGEIDEAAAGNSAEKGVTVEAAMAVVLSAANETQRQRMTEALSAMAQVENSKRFVESFYEVAGR